MGTVRRVRPARLVLLVAVTLAVNLLGAAPTWAASDGAAPLSALLAVQQAQLTAADGGSYFALDVAIDGDTAVVSADRADVGTNTQQGAVYIFVRSGTSWTQQARLTASDGDAQDLFGTAVAISGDTVVVGNLWDDIGANANQGSAYVFVRSGTTWSQQTKLTAADGAANDWFGLPVAIKGDTAVVGAFKDDVGTRIDQGSAYVFARSGTTWSQQAHLTAADGVGSDRFGYSVAVAGSTAVVGAYGDDVGVNEDQGSAYVFVRNGSMWWQQTRLSAADGAAGDFFGSSVAVAGSTAVVGAYDDDVGANADQGSAYVFTRSDATWSQQTKLTAADGAANDYFGDSVAVARDTAVVGAYGDDVGANADQGSAYVFTRSGTSWSQRDHLIAADGATGDRLGDSVAVSGDTAVLAAPHDDVGAAQNKGSARVFTGVLAPPGTPVARSPKGIIASRTPTFRWRIASGAASYQVRVYKGTSLIRKRTGVGGLSWKCTRALPQGVWLTWKVRAVNEAGPGPWSARLRFKVPG